MPEKLYLVCECGEAFDSLETAMQHRIEQGQSPEFRIMTESEAM